ncbi:hypothetical protein L3X38_026087 [Prunus dulcis]|uniref:Uncharacterized protein n=1 Tax=Prunus dulcis TaxID=3755 RepID=A0AAD4W428_PRUDU|nr:hypothetical protein L3X38_026087 [Prunus dulcis]
MLVWRINWKKPCPVKKSIDLCYGRRQEKINRETSMEKLIDDLKKQVSEGTLIVSGSNDVLTLALGTLEHGGRVRGVGAGGFPNSILQFAETTESKIC